jgi:hypothetical protein
MRYVKNNFFDGDRQDSYDILTGAWVEKRGGIPPLTDTRPLIMRAVSLLPIYPARCAFSFVVDRYRWQRREGREGERRRS